MTSSQVRTTAALALGGLAAAFAAIEPHIGLLPAASAEPIRTVAGIVSVLSLFFTAFNQSLSGSHLSVPIAEAEGMSNPPPSVAKQLADK